MQGDGEMHTLANDGLEPLILDACVAILRQEEFVAHTNEGC